VHAREALVVHEHDAVHKLQAQQESAEKATDRHRKVNSMCIQRWQLRGCGGAREVDLNSCRAACVDDFVQLFQAASIGEGPETTNNDGKSNMEIEVKVQPWRGIG
jgi:hypothetical protein